MPRDEIPFAREVLATGEGAPSLDRKMEMLATLRTHSQELGRKMDRFVLEQYERLHQEKEDLRLGLTEAQAKQQKLKAILDELSAPPWHPAIFLRPETTPEGPRARVAYGNTRSVVAVAGEVRLGELEPGDEVFLGNQLNVVLAKSPLGAPAFGETAILDRRLPDARLVLKSRDEEVVIEPAGTLAGAEIKPGDQIRFDKAIGLGYEVIPRPSEGRRYFLEEVKDVPVTQVGGQDHSLRRLIQALTVKLVDPDLAKVYGLDGQRTAMMIGPPGCGKTLMARVAVSETARIGGGKRASFAVVKPAAFEDPFVGVTEANIRSFFAALREAAKDGYAVAFFDEVETIGRIRGGVANQHADRFLGAFLAEVNGFEDSPNVAIISASNRKDLLDPAVAERLGEIEIVVGRPDMKGARAIFSIHLSADYPFSPNGSAAGSTRQEAIETAVSMLYSPNADNELCVLRFRDSKTRTVTARELVSGRLIQQICKEARQSAFFRHRQTGEPGITARDVRDAVANALSRLATTLSPRNVHTYLPDLSTDTDVVDVRPIDRKVARPHRYLSVA